MKVGFATSAELPQLTDDDQIAATALKRSGIAVHPVVWSREDPIALAAAVDVVVIRSCWDYHHRPGDFVAWVDAVARSGAEVVNPPELVRWNLHKGYLAELSARGVRTVPTRALTRGGAELLAELLADAGWMEAVVKPAVSLSAYETWRTSPAEAGAHQPRFAALAAAADVLVQPYVPEIASAGEWSLVFLGGEYSHAVRKRPRPGDFRVQVEHGGSVAAEAPPPEVLEDAARALAAAPGRAPYARVDGVEVHGRLVLMELECIDPVLFFAAHPPAADRLAQLLAGSGR